MKLLSIIACAILAIALAAAPAEAKKKKKKKPPLGPVVTTTATGNTVNAPGDVSTATATCPPGTKALGGGFVGPFSGTSAVVIFASYRSGEQSWSVAGVQAGPGTGNATAFAYCRRTTKAVVDVAAATPVPAGVGMTASTSARCPSGTQLISGGFISTSGPSGLDVSFASTNLSTAPGTWSVTALQNGNTTPQTMTAHAYCMSGIRAPTILNATNSPPVAPSASNSVTSPPCPTPKKPKKGKKKKKKKPRQLLTAGGHSSPASDFHFYTDSHIGAGGWLATAVRVGGSTGPFSVTSQGICV
jgi:hypothetical protein